MRKRLERLPKGENKPAKALNQVLARGCESGSGGLILKILKPRLYDFTVPRSERPSDSAVAATPIVLEATGEASDDAVRAAGRRRPGFRRASATRC